MAFGDYVPPELVIGATLLGGTGVYLTYIPTWISDLFGFQYDAGLQIALILLLFLPVSLTLARVTKLTNSSIETDGGQITVPQSTWVTPTGWGGYGGGVIGGTLGIPFETLGIFAGIVVGAVLGVGIEHVYLNYSFLARSIGAAILPDPDIPGESPAAEAGGAADADVGPTPLEREIEEDITFIRNITTEEEFFIQDVEQFRERREARGTFFELHPTRWHGWEWLFVDSQGDVRARSPERYPSLSDAIHDIEELPGMPIEVDMFRVEVASFQVYTDTTGNQRWRLVTESEETVWESETGYESEDLLVESIVEFKEREIVDDWER